MTSRVEVARTGRTRAGRVRGRAGVTSLAPPVDPDAARLEELGYRQELARGLHLVDNAAMGFAGISPVVGLYAVALVGLTVAGPAWVWSSRRADWPMPVAGRVRGAGVGVPDRGGAYQWSRRLMGGTYGWLSGWVAICAYCAANTTIAYLGAPGPSRSWASRPRPTRSW